MRITWKLKAAVFGTLAMFAAGSAIGSELAHRHDLAYGEQLDPAMQMAQRHDCWGSNEVAHVPIPGHVILVRKGRPVYGGPLLTRWALEQRFDHVNHHLHIVEFCR